MEITLQIQDENDLKWLLPLLERLKIPFSKKIAAPSAVSSQTTVPTEEVFDWDNLLNDTYLNRQKNNQALTQDCNQISGL